MKVSLVACYECRKRHRRCTRNVICERCKRLGLNCIYYHPKEIREMIDAAKILLSFSKNQ